MKAFSSITTSELRNEFGITIQGKDFIPSIDPIEPPVWLRHIIEKNTRKLATMRSEKAISEALIAPLLMAVEELFDDEITIFSGEPLASEKIAGVCDFLISKTSQALEPQGSYCVLVEAKKQDLLSGISQCVAEMYVAQLLNADNAIVYGCVTTGLEWLFIKLEDNKAFTNSKIYALVEIKDILGVFGWLIKTF
jgi:hypothetical protein